MTTPRTVSRSRPTALTRAEHSEGPIHLNVAERKVLEEALREGEDLRVTVEAAVLSYGRWLLEKVFNGDSTKALDDKSENPVWRELVRRAGGPTLNVSRHLIYIAVRIAANDKRIIDRAWRGLDAGRKELLLPLGETSRLREAAQHVSKFNLTQAKTKEYVAGLITSQGKRPRIRLTSKAFATRIKNARVGLTGKDMIRKVRELRTHMKPRERETVTQELAELRDSLSEMIKALRRG